MALSNIKILVYLPSVLLQKAVLMILYDYFPSYEIVVSDLNDSLETNIDHYQPQIVFVDCNDKLNVSDSHKHLHLIGISYDSEKKTDLCHSTIFLNDSPSTIVEKIKSALYLFQSEPSTENTLSDREKEILALIATGFSNKEIASKLFLSPHTVITHRKNITAKLGIKTISGLTLYALLNGLVNLQEDQLK
jgi:DNA-binding CsgD family transcriptional regulator